MMKMSHAREDKKDQIGFTLMEVTIAVGLLALVSVVSVNVVANLSRSAVKSQAGVDIERASDFVLLKIKSDINRAVSVQVSPDLKTLTINQGPALGSVDYKILASGNCASAKVGGCIKRNSTYLTDSTDSPSAVSVEPTDSRFSAVTDKDGASVIAVNVVMKFKKPSVAGSAGGNFSGESVVNTTIALPVL